MTKDLLGHRVARGLELAADAIRARNLNESRAILAETTTLIRHFEQSAPGFKDDPALGRDVRLLETYQSLLANPHESLQSVFEALELAALQKVRPTPDPLSD